MKIADINITSLEIPFKESFSHTSAKRDKTQSVLVRVLTDKGFSGYGEGCPREYVTQENIKTSIIFFKKYKKNIIKNIHSLQDLKNWIHDNEKLIDLNPAAWCAIELALLEALANEKKCSVEQLLGLSDLSESFTYSAVIGNDSLKIIESKINRYKNLNFSNIKVKITGNSNEDNAKCNLINAGFPSAEIRLDANNIWRNVNDVLRYLDSITFSPNFIEEPLQALDFKEIKKFCSVQEIPIILDESFLNKNHFNEILDNSNQMIINLRISKMGGLIRSIDIAEKAKKEKINIVVGAQVGETSILTRAGLIIANQFKSIVIAQEGAAGIHLLSYDITDKPLTFGKEGILKIYNFLNLQEYGWQIKYNNELLNLFSDF